jgi:hypothetical protein
MKTGVSIEQVLRWRLALAEAEAPRAPRAAQLLELARPWWERSPEQFQNLLQSLMRLEMAVGHAMAETRLPRTQHPVPTLIVRANEQIETCVRVLYLSVRESRLHFRFVLDAGANPLEEDFEATFILNSPAKPLFSADAIRSVDSEYRLDVEISAELVEEWRNLKVTDAMPFRLILHPKTNAL